jgi:hypothetical protein
MLSVGRARQSRLSPAFRASCRVRAEIPRALFRTTTPAKTQTTPASEVATAITRSSGMYAPITGTLIAGSPVRNCSRKSATKRAAPSILTTSRRRAYRGRE